MKKQQLLILSLLFIVFPTLKAGDRTEQQMKEAAAKVLNTNLRRAAGNHELKEFHSLSKLKIYGYDEGGFAVVTKDDRFEDVIGYSTSKCTEEMPCGFKWWLDAANEAMENAKDQAPAKATRRSAIRRTGVSALLTSKWGQARPYNNKCKIIIAGEEYPMVTGCVATAMAQVMNYYKYPQKGKGENSYTINYDVGAYTFYSNFENSYYDWNNMLDDYSAYWYSNTENQYTDAVSKLMSDCGIAVNMKYNISSSGTYSNLIPIALKDYFSYSFVDNTKNIYYRINYPNSDEWMNMVYNNT